MEEIRGISPSEGVGVDSSPTLENVFVFFIKSLMKLVINTVTSLTSGSGEFSEKIAVAT